MKNWKSKIEKWKLKNNEYKFGNTTSFIVLNNINNNINRNKKTKWKSNKIPNQIHEVNLKESCEE